MYPHPLRKKTPKNPYYLYMTAQPFLRAPATIAPPASLQHSQHAPHRTHQRHHAGKDGKAIPGSPENAATLPIIHQPSLTSKPQRMDFCFSCVCVCVCMGSSYCCIVSCLRTLSERHKSQNCDNDGTNTTH